MKHLIDSILDDDNEYHFPLDCKYSAVLLDICSLAFGVVPRDLLVGGGC
jgi:hypothetical protein